MVRVITLISTVLVFTELLSMALATHDNAVQIAKNDDDCNMGFSGPDCDIPYSICNDGHRKCFNNSRCVKNNRKDSYTGNYDYHCDCSYAAEVSSYAGHECEHSSTIICKKPFTGTHFCTNGGECGSYFLNGSEHTGCSCPEDFEGAHCQYLIGTMDGKLLGETMLPKYGSNFYGFIPENTPKREASKFAIGVITTVLLAVVLMTGLYSLKKYRGDSEVIANEKIGKNQSTISPKVDDTRQLLENNDGGII